ncbi:ABC transporter ATP-binding protein [Neptunitalea chrysea]|uniref:ABC transporter ATP-binding protein n=1 Tax=Neptunitalea chrysea TaxID=1647581 RepID=A0A9W6B340_9FLAO|nr:peptidase domain-containing ABC transporter [Neptunitalea chrysea]GLB51504.1 ABC transporter ATP-binding protein [Neptunitalea chrysea]
MTKFPHYKQPDHKDCGPTCLKIICKYFGKTFNLQELRSLSETQREGSNLLNLTNAAEAIGLRTLPVKLNLNKLKEATLPCILHWNKNHYVVLYKISKGKYYISDPGFGLITYDEKDFLDFWIGKNSSKEAVEGIALLVEPTPKFYQFESVTDIGKPEFGFKLLFKYILKYKRFIYQLALGLLTASILQLIMPFLTQSVVDVGITNQDIKFIYLVLIAQLMLFIGRTSVEVIRGWILLHLSTRINISLISDFFIKLMKLPIAFFDSRMTGDILQRINDHNRIERILTTSSLNVLFSMVNLLVFSFVLIYYSATIFGIFFIGSFLYFLWIVIFLKKRKTLDYKRFSQVSQEQSKVIEIINGMQEIKLHNAEKQKRWGWEYVQARLFKVSIEGLALEQYQSVGSQFINELKNIIITIISAKLVIDGSITLGMMLAISTIVGQLNSPIAQLIGFIREVQDAKISLDRLSEIHNREEEDTNNINTIHDINPKTPIRLKNISFRYSGSDEYVLKDLDLIIPPQKITAVVGTSGSGKTTLMKLLLKFYDPDKGELQLGNHNFKNLLQRSWRDQCGVVMQEGFIFNDTIAYNIAIGETIIDKEKLLHAVTVANIREFIERLPLSYNTKIGNEGIGLSTGQKQRILIARAVYKNPNLLFFDEATSALDANNEKIIMNHLNTFFENKTVVIIAHRLSTVKNAHQIVVLEQGKIVEIGNHTELVAKKGNYYHLVKNQLELGN